MHEVAVVIPFVAASGNLGRRSLVDWGSPDPSMSHRFLMQGNSGTILPEICARCLQAPCDLLAPCSCSVSTFDAWVAEWFDGQRLDDVDARAFFFASFLMFSSFFV